MKITLRGDAFSTIYKAAARAMVSTDFSAPPVERISPQPSFVNGDVGALISAAETELLAAIADKFSVLRAAARARSVAGELQPNAGLDDLVRPMMILRDYDISRAELFRRCVEHPVGTPGGFSLRRDGEGSHLISLSRFDRHFRQYPPRKRRSETEK
ncbi:hypothetical protein ACTGJ9_020980 [Bradyrhizobium sp. RDM12]